MNITVVPAGEEEALKHETSWTSCIRLSANRRVWKGPYHYITFPFLTSPPAACIVGFLWHTTAYLLENPEDKTHDSELLSLLRHPWAFAYFLFPLFIFSLYMHTLYHNEVTAREVKRLIAVLTRPTLCSDVVQESMKVWAITERTASTLSVTCTSKTNCGFFKMLTQKRKGKL